MTELALRDHADWPIFARRFFDLDLDPAPHLRIEEYQDGNTLVVKAEMPGIDPDKDVEISVHNGLLHLRGERTEKSMEKNEGSFRSEFRYGRFDRALPLPAGATAEDVAASYDDGVLEVRIPVRAAVHETAKITVRRR